MVRVLARWLLSGKSRLNTLRTLGCWEKHKRENMFHSWLALIGSKYHNIFGPVFKVFSWLVYLPFICLKNWNYVSTTCFLGAYSVQANLLTKTCKHMHIDTETHTHSSSKEDQCFTYYLLYLLLYNQSLPCYFPMCWANVSTAWSCFPKRKPQRPERSKCFQQDPDWDDSKLCAVPEGNRFHLWTLSKGWCR